MSSHCRPHRDLLRHAITTLVLVMLAAGCTNTGQADPDPLPSGTALPSSNLTSEPSPTPSATPEGPTADQVLELVDEYRNVLLALPQLPPDQAADYITARAEELTTDQGTARQRLHDQTTTIRDAADADFVPIMRGTPHTALLDEPSLSGDNWTTTACVATQGQFTDVTTGEPGELEPADSAFTEVDVALVEADGSWLVKDYAASNGDDQTPCVPPAVEEAVTTNWEAFATAWAQWEGQGLPDDLGELSSLTTDDFAETLRGLGDIDPIAQEDQAPFTDLHLLHATPSRVEGEYCRNGAFRGVWILEGDRWLIDSGQSQSTDEGGQCE